MPSLPGLSGTLNGPGHTGYDPGDQAAGPTARWAFTGPLSTGAIVLQPGTGHLG